MPHLNPGLITKKLLTEFISVVSKLWFDKSIELILLRSVLVNRGSGKILNKHIRAETILKKPVRVQDSLLIANAILEETSLLHALTLVASTQSGLTKKPIILP